MVSLTQLPQNVCIPCARLSDNASSKMSLHRVPGLRDTITLKRLCAVCQVYVTIFPLQRLFAVCQIYVTQLP